MPTAHVFDVVVVGGGVVGCAVARELSRLELSVAIVEARRDVGAGTSKANTAILHTGFDAVPGSIESRLVARGYQLLRDYAPTVGVSVEQSGAVLVAWDDEQAATLPRLTEKAAANGYSRAEVIDAATVRELEPHLGDGVTGGMIVPDEHLIDPWSTPIQAGGYVALAPLINAKPPKAPSDELSVAHPAIFRIPGYVSDADQIFIFKDARTGASEITITESGFNQFKELKADTDGVDKVFISKTPVAVKGLVYWADRAGAQIVKHPLDVDVKAGANDPAGPLRVKVTKTKIEDWT